MRCFERITRTSKQYFELKVRRLGKKFLIRGKYRKGGSLDHDRVDQ